MYQIFIFFCKQIPISIQSTLESLFFYQNPLRRRRFYDLNHRTPVSYSNSGVRFHNLCSICTTIVASIFFSLFASDFSKVQMLNVTKSRKKTTLFSYLPKNGRNNSALDSRAELSLTYLCKYRPKLVLYDRKNGIFTCQRLIYHR